MLVFSRGNCYHYDVMPRKHSSVTGEENPLVSGGLPSQRASDARTVMLPLMHACKTVELPVTLIFDVNVMIYNF